LPGSKEATPFRDHVPHVDEVRQLRLVELLVDAGSDLALHEGDGGHDDIVAGAAGQQLGFQRLVGIEGVVDDLDAGFLGEIFEDGTVDVIGPVVDVDDAILSHGRRSGKPSHERGGCKPCES
jgi:hypothetical protein